MSLSQLNASDFSGFGNSDGDVEIKYSSDKKITTSVVVAQDGTGDYDNLRDAINELPQEGGQIFVKKGFYELDNLIIGTHDYVSIIGEGPNSILLCATTGANVTAVTIGSVADRDKYVSFENLCLDYSQGANNFFLQSVTNTFLKIKNCYIYGPVPVAASSCKFINSTAGRGQMENCFTYRGGFSIEVKDYWRINNNLLQARILVGSYCIVSNNTIKNAETNFTHGIETGNDYNIFEGNYLESCGMWAENGTNNSVIKGNICIGSTAHGIHIHEESDNNIIMGNICRDNDRGIYIEHNTNDKNIVVGNICLNNDTANYTDGGTNTTAANNITA
jgi:parallel beta-helix repeat protein